MSTIRANTLTDASGANSMPVADINQGRAKVWAKVDMSGVITINDSFNVASVTDVTTGTYTASLTTAMANANGSGAGSSGAPGSSVRGTQAAFDSASVIRHFAFGSSFTGSDVDRCTLVGFGD